VALTYHARNMENALEWVREHVHKLMQNYIDIKKGKHVIYNANGEKIK
jgi:hypothetical protein